MKLYIRAMSYERNRALKQAGVFTTDIFEHVIKIIVYGDIRREQIPHWITEIAEWIYDASTITVKPNNRKLKPRDIEYTTFSAMGDEVRDYERDLKAFRLDNKRGKFNYEDKKSYPDFEVTRQLSETLMNCCFDIMEHIIPMLTGKQDHSREEYRVKLTEIFNNYI